MLASILYLFFSLYMLISIIVATGEVVLVPVACMFYMTLSPWASCRDFRVAKRRNGGGGDSVIAFPEAGSLS